MSSFLTRLFANVTGQQLIAQNQQPKFNDSISTLNQSINKVTDTLLENPFVLINTLGFTVSNNVSANTVMFQGVPVPVGYRCIVRDFNINYSPTGGSCNIVVMDYNGKNILNQVSTAISASSSGFGGTVLDDTETLAITANSQGNGTISAYITGVLKKKVYY